ncbi:chemotaxis protein [Paraburkholderia acidisoli]|uniref:Response regulator n=1 Tax=Paraburkholderia acidisoli TaxID=2571748 RepID=A0A7Z2GQK5_9BURK|nr:chemotaxis protein [Paraburkholderia acidisoli]QGZ65864.1 response regulator [Paraburkholderia acidisoli]
MESGFAIDERTRLTSTNQFELLLFRLGAAPGSSVGEAFGINVFKVREILSMPTITPIAASSEYVLGAANIRGQVMPVINLPKLMGCEPATGLNILLVTEFARTTQGFALESVDEIVRLEWSQVLAADVTLGNRVTSIARLEADPESKQLVQVVDVEQVLRDVFPAQHKSVEPEEVGEKAIMPAGAKVLAADDSGFARELIGQSLTALGLEYSIAKTGLEAWNQLDAIARSAERDGVRAKDRVALVLTDLEMPEMDGFTLTRKIKADPRTADIPVVIHSSLSGTANEAHVKNAGASGYVAKFAAGDLAGAIRKALTGKSAYA